MNHYDSTAPYPRDLVGYGRNPPHAQWPAGARVAVQGFGNVGGVAARLFAENGARIVAVQDHSATIYRAAGLDVPALLAHVARAGGVF